MSGDHTLAASIAAVEDVTKEPGVRALPPLILRCRAESVRAATRTIITCSCSRTRTWPCMA